MLNVSAAASSLNLVLRDEGLMKFVKYLSAQAAGSRCAQRAGQRAGLLGRWVLDVALGWLAQQLAGLPLPACLCAYLPEC